MLIKCLVDHQISQNETQHFHPGQVYDVPDDLARRLLNEYGRPQERTQPRSDINQVVKFERVRQPGDQVMVFRDGVEETHTVTEDEAYDGEVVKVTPQGIIEPGASGEVDHSHRSQSEPQQPPYGDEKLQQDGDNTESDRTTATQGASGTGAPTGQVGTGRPGDTLASNVGGPASAPERQDPYGPGQSYPSGGNPGDVLSGDVSGSEGAHTHEQPSTSTGAAPRAGVFGGGVNAPSGGDSPSSPDAPDARNSENLDGPEERGQ